MPIHHFYFFRINLPIISLATTGSLYGTYDSFYLAKSPPKLINTYEDRYEQRECECKKYSRVTDNLA
jgi:uncharacterized membrane protein SpoIIM required for sporulation